MPKAATPPKVAKTETDETAGYWAGGFIDSVK